MSEGSLLAATVVGALAAAVGGLAVLAARRGSKPGSERGGGPLVALLVLVGGFLGVQLGPSIAVAVSLPAWRTVSSVEGRFHVEFPGEPTASSRILAGASALEMHRLDRRASLWRASFELTWCDLPPEASQDVQGALDRATAGRVADVQGRLLEERRVEAGGRPGREFTVRATGARFSGRSVLAGRRLYVAVVAESDSNPLPPGVARRFLASLELTSG